MEVREEKVKEENDKDHEQRPAAEVVADRRLTIFGVPVWSREFAVGLPVGF